MAHPVVHRPWYGRRVERAGYVERDDGVVLRVVASLAAAVPTIIGLIALARIPWSSGGFDAPATEVAGMTFTPWVAIGTAVLGFLGLLAAASWDRSSKFIMGGLLMIAGLVIYAAKPTDPHVVLENRHGTMFLVVGLVIAAAGLLMTRMGGSEVVEEDETYV